MAMAISIGPEGVRYRPGIGWCAFGKILSDEPLNDMPSIEVHVDGTFAARDEAKPPRDGGHHSFEIPLPPQFTYQSTATLSLQTSGAEQATLSAEFPSVVGSFDTVDRLLVKGWACLTKASAQKAVVQLLADNVVVEKAIADGFRADVRDAGFGDGYFGYVMIIPLEVCDGLPHELSVNVANIGQVLTPRHPFRVSRLALSTEVRRLYEQMTDATSVVERVAELLQRASDSMPKVDEPQDDLWVLANAAKK